MNEVELLNTANEIISRQDRVFEFWLSASFAVVISFFFISERATKPAKHLLAGLYIASTILFTSRWVSLALIYNKMWFDLGALDSRYIIPFPQSAFAFISSLCIILVGTISTTCFIYMGQRLVKSSASST